MSFRTCFYGVCLFFCLSLMLPLPCLATPAGPSPVTSNNSSANSNLAGDFGSGPNTANSPVKTSQNAPSSAAATTGSGTAGTQGNGGATPSSPAPADPPEGAQTGRRFSLFSVDVPAGWTATEEDGVVFLIAGDKSAALTVAYRETGGAGAQEIAEALAKELGGDTPRQEGEAWLFSFRNEHGVESRAVLSVQGPRFALFILTGESPLLGEILRSVRDN